METPQSFDLEEHEQRIFLRQKLEAAERDCDDGRSLDHDQAVAEAASWFRAEASSL